jgi:hypothetical protein
MPTRVHPAKVHYVLISSASVLLSLSLHICFSLYHITTGLTDILCIGDFLYPRFYSVSGGTSSVLAANNAEATAHAQCVVRQFPYVPRHFDSVVSFLSPPQT